jgi:hypothetical protein
MIMESHLAGFRRRQQLNITSCDCAARRPVLSCTGQRTAHRRQMAARGPSFQNEALRTPDMGNKSVSPRIPGLCISHMGSAQFIQILSMFYSYHILSFSMHHSAIAAPPECPT